MPSVLIVDDLLSIHEMLEAVIQPTGFTTVFATDGEKGLVRYKAEKFDLVLADIDMKPMDGITLLKQIKLYDPSAVIIIMTAYASTESAAQALKYGAFDYLQKPFRVDELISTLRRGLEFKQFQTARTSADADVPMARSMEMESLLIGQSPAIKKLIQQVKKLASVRTPVLLAGEPGTGKDTVAEILHTAASAEGAPLMKIDCAQSDEETFRTGLIGRNGAIGEWVQQAGGGTLLLQQPHCLPLSIQRELVSVMRNAGQTFRLICTTSEDLEKLTDEGKFHDELFYRVASLPVQLPPLRERAKDVPLLVKNFAARVANPAFDTNLIEFADDAMAVLMTYRWPGNLTELDQVVSKLISTTETRVITAAQLPLRLSEVKSWPSLADHLAGQRKEYIGIVLHACDGDRAGAAKILGIDPTEVG